MTRRDAGTVLVVANERDADTGYVGERLVERGFSLRTVVRERREVPASPPDGIVLVLLLGSAWSVHAPVDETVLERESALARSAPQAGVPVLGLCYGAQVLAHAHGGSVAAAPQPEVGLVTVVSQDPELVPPGPWVAFHSDVTEPPPGARVVAHNDCGVQAFVMPGSLGVQFHPEVRPEVLEEWTAELPEMLQAAGTDREELLSSARSREAEARAAAYALVDAFLDGVRHLPLRGGLPREA